MKIYRKNGVNLMDYSCNVMQNLNVREAELILNKPRLGLLPFKTSKKNGNILLTYFLEDQIPLSEFLRKNVLSQREFFAVVNAVVRLEIQIQENHLNHNLVLFQPEYVFVDPYFLQMKFVYVPVQPYCASGSIYELFQDIIQYATFDPNENLQYVQDFISLTNQKASFSLFQIENYLNKYSVNEGSRDSATCPNCGFTINKSDNFCTACGMAIPKKETAACDIRKRKTVEAKEKAEEVVTFFRASKTQAFLTKDTVETEITQFPFYIGKQKNLVDFRIPNHTVSRKHAEIVREGKHYFIIDLASTNGTFLNRHRLQSGLKEEIKSGDTIRFADTVYTFLIKEG